MRVLLVSKFLHHVGGVETYLHWLANALEGAGHDVGVVGMSLPEGREMMDFGNAAVYWTPYRDFTRGSLALRVRSSAASVYSLAARKVVKGALEDFEPDVVHFHGTCYQLTSSVVQEVGAKNIPRIATMHEYKLACANQRLWDDSRAEICTACVGRSGLSRFGAPIQRRCIKGSLGASTLGAIEDSVSSRVWRRDQSLLLHTPSRFVRDLLIQDNWPAERLTHLDLPWTTRGETEGDSLRSGFLYLGRLAPEKGVGALIEGWRRCLPLFGDDEELLIAGDGADAERLQSLAGPARGSRVRFLGRLTRAEIFGMLDTVRATVHPADWFENSPIAVRESLGSGVPALVARRGGMPELIDEGITGMTTENTPEGWSDVLLRFQRSGIHAGPAVREHIAACKVDGNDHLAGLCDLYGRAAA